jgi:hypothetical protein
MNQMFESTFNGLRDDNQGVFKDLGIKTMDDLYHTWDDAVRNGAKRGSPAAALTRAVAADPELEDSLNAYGELWKKTLDQIGGAMGKSGDELDTWESHMHTWKQVVESMGGPLETVAQATDNYNKALDDYKSSHAGADMPQDLKLIALNAERAKLGLEPTTNLLDMFTVAAANAGAEAEAAAGHFKNMADALNTDWAMNNLTGDGYANMMKDAMSGAADYVYETAQKGAERAEKAKEKAIQDGGARQVEALKKQEKAVQDQYDADSKALQDKNDKDKKAIEDKYKGLSDMYDKDIKQAEDAAKAKTDAINDEIKALQKDDEARQKLFQNETNRIERMAQMQNTSIDFNSALNSGNIDEAAKIMNNASAQQTGWMLQDQQAKMDDASKAQQDNLQAEIDAINAAKDEYVQAEQAKKDALADQKQAELDALDAVYQAQKDAMDKKKQLDLDALQASEDAVNKDTQNKLAAQQQTYQDNIDKLNLELAALKASVPANAQEVQQLADTVREKYKALGIDLENVSGAWTGDLYTAIAGNIDRARLSAADAAKWQQVGKFISDQIAAGSGFSIDQVLTYLRTGTWPDAAPSATAPAPTPANLGQGLTNGDWIGAFLNNVLGKPNTPSAPSGGGTQSNLPGLPPVRHGGGILGMDGLNSRGNIPWSAPLQPSETFALLQHGEYVVNRDAAANNMALLEAINSGMVVRHSGGPVLGGLTDGISMAMTSAMLLQSNLMEAAIVKGMYKQAFNRWILQTLNPANWLTGNVPAAPVDVSGNKKIVMDLAAKKYGWQGSEWDALYQLVMSESGFRNTAQNPTSTAYGMFQFLDSTWRGYGVPKTSDPTQQAIAGLAYVKARYGDPINAWAFHKAHNWYDNGGFLMPGATMTMNATGKPEPVFTADQWRILSSLVAQNAQTHNATGPLVQAVNELKASIDSGNNSNYTVNVDMTGANISSTVDMEKAVYNALVKIDAKTGRSRTIR